MLNVEIYHFFHYIVERSRIKRMKKILLFLLISAFALLPSISFANGASLSDVEIGIYGEDPIKGGHSAFSEDPIKGGHSVFNEDPIKGGHSTTNEEPIKGGH